MTGIPSHRYAEWRAQVLAGTTLREGGGTAPSERLLQEVWLHQRLRRDRLRTLDGRLVRILHPGFWNREAGPDFQGGIVQFDDEPPRTGDIEIDLHPGGWRSHGHDRNPAYGGVILHAVWNAEPDARYALPTLALKPHLDAPITALSTELGSDADTPPLLAGNCSAPLGSLPDSELRVVLRQAAQVRLERKGEALAARAREAGWEQALWEGLFIALGYKHNAWPMRRLAELLPGLEAGDSRERDVVLIWQTRLLGVGGLLPTDLTRARSGAAYLRRVWDRWWRERDRFLEFLLPRALWRFDGLRPANHPQRRLALAAHWLAAGDLPRRLEQWLADEIPDAGLVNSLLNVLQTRRDEFWSWHWTFRSRRLARPQPLLGAQRVTDLAMNVVLPWIWTRAVAGKHEAPRRIAEHRYFAWPEAGDNAVLRLARQRLLGRSNPSRFRQAALQQGLLQIVRDFCARSNALCENCRFPGLVRGLKTPAAVEFD